MMKINTFYSTCRPLPSLDLVNTGKLNVIFHSVIIFNLKGTHVIIVTIKPHHGMHEDNHLISR